MHHDWRLFDACRTGDENELLGLLQDGVNPNLRGTNSKIYDPHTLNPHWQILETSSRNFSEFFRYEPDLFLENSSINFWEYSV